MRPRGDPAARTGTPHNARFAASTAPAAPVAAAIAAMRFCLPSPVDVQACFRIAVPCLRGGGAALLSPPLG